MESLLQESSPDCPFEITGIVNRKLDELSAWPGNPRRHPAKQIAKLAANMKRYGVTNAIVTDEHGVVLSGHGRLEAARQLNLASVPTRMIKGLTPAQKTAFVIADNQLGDLSSFDENLLREQLTLLIHDEIEIEFTGMDTAEIDLMFDETDQNRAADPGDLQADDLSDEPISREGDLWGMGHHRLLCGNALDPESYATLMQGERAQMVITDPPYNVRVNGHVCGSGKIQHAEFAMASGEMSREEFTAFLRRVCELSAHHSQAGAIVYMFMDFRHQREVLVAADPVFGALKQLCVWVKDNAGMGTFYRSQHELVFVFKKGTEPHINNFGLGEKGRYRTNVWQYRGATLDELATHPTVKPFGMIADALRDCSHRQGIVLDPFAGSGTILVAAERTGRHARAIELEPKYVDVGIRRWQRMTGKSAILLATGQTWDEVRAERLDDPNEGDDHGL